MTRNTAIARQWGWHAQNLITLLQYVPNDLEMEAFKPLLPILVLHGVVLEPPLRTLELHHIVDIRKQARDGEVSVRIDIPHELDLWDAITADRKAEAHGGGLLCGRGRVRLGVVGTLGVLT